MYIPFLTPRIRRFHYKQALYLMRGYRFLKKSGKLDLLIRLKDALANETLPIGTDNASPLIFGEGLESAELIVRQYLSVRISGRGLVKAILVAYGSGKKVVYPLPLEWRRVFDAHDVPVASFKCAALWYGYLWMIWGYGVIHYCKYLYREYRAFLKNEEAPASSYAYFERLAPANLPQPAPNGQSYDIVSWYLQWEGRNKNLTALRHGVKGQIPSRMEGLRIEYAKDAVPTLKAGRLVGRFILQGFAAAALASFDLVRGRWWHAFLLAESIKAIRARIAPAENLAADYLFHNSGWLYRPLWTYEAEKKGCRVLFYFYSTNTEVFKRAEGYTEIQHNTWQLINWPIYLVWDECQKEFIRRFANAHPVIEIVGPIWFSSNAEEPQDFQEKTIAVFDVQPHRRSRYPLFALPFEYYTPPTVNKFLQDTYAVLKECGVVMAHKRKRKGGKILSPFYMNVVQRLAEDESAVISVKPDISAIRVIEKSMAVISMPFTSTAILGVEAGKPSVYYDPSGVVQKDDRAARGIQIISDVDELRDWVRNLLATS